MKATVRASIAVAITILWTAFGFRFGAAQPDNSIKGLIDQLRTPEGKIKYLAFMVPGGPIFKANPPMEKLVEKGNAVQASLLPHLKEAGIRNEIAYVLGRVGDKDAVPHLIDCLPTGEKLTDEQETSTMCLLQALGCLTGNSTGLGRFGLQFGPKVRKQWQEWHAENKDYFYSPAEAKPSSWGRPNVLVDVEAMIAGQPTVAYRKKHPRVKFDEIKTWIPGTGDQGKLKDFCFSILRDSLNRDAVRSLPTSQRKFHR